MAKFKVVVLPCDYDDLDVEREILEPLGAEVVRVESFDKEEIAEAARDADALLVQHTYIDEELLSKLRKCKVAVRYGTGYDNFDLDAMTRHGVYAAYVPDYCTDEVAAHALALLLALERKIVRYNDRVREGVWSSLDERPIFDLRERTLGIIGLGRIGGALASKAKGIYGGIIACDPYIPEGRFAELGVERVDMDELFERSDAVSVHVPLFRKPTGIYRPTYHLIGERELRRMKPTSYIVNTSRGGVIDTEALVKALREGWIAGAALDVIEGEPPRGRASTDLHLKLGDLLREGKLILTPHAGYLSERALREVRRRAAEEVARVLKGGRPLNCLNQL
ncbi:C-terminal binding protein [Candidatus Poribacteria bacterium]|nr:MAG: C-terminal binding protein [Candidatus Poribacteria bacterium]